MRNIKHSFNCPHCHKHSNRQIDTIMTNIGYEFVLQCDFCRKEFSVIFSI